ncbi:MAG: HD domain-containing protein [Omnitrophica bacterium]|nr:HD domain-containing protein [Candidatus Omnitrophota bacterium]
MTRYRKVFSAFHNIYRLVTTFGDIQNFATGICRLYRSAFRADKVVMVCKNISSAGFLKVRLENKSQYIKKGGLSVLGRIEKQILKQQKEIISNNRLIYPFVFTDVLGAIYIKRSSKIKSFDEIEKKWFLSLCEEVSMGLKVFYSFHEQQKIMVSYIKSLSRFLNQYVPTSYLHTKPMFKLIKAMGKIMKLSEAEIKSLEYASTLHDAGKIQVPSGLLKKDAPLTDEEYTLMTKHPRKGIELIKNLEILKPAIPIILHHHERYDGKGYPSKLKKDKIPLGSRILAILDTFDAMYFGRPYRKERPMHEIEQELKKQKGKQFDPKIVEAFLKILKRKSIRKYLKSSPSKLSVTGKHQ